MSDGARLSTTACASALALLLFGQCRRQEVPQAAPPPATADGARVVAAAPPPTAPAPPADDAADAASAPPSTGAWLDANIYRFRLEAVRRCTPSAPGGATRIGVLVRVTAKNIDDLLVAPRDFRLESGGTTVDSAILPKAPTGCAPLLAPKSLRPGKTADGVVVFDLPAGFAPADRPVKIAYQPTRWGGARRVEAVLPPESLAP